MTREQIILSELAKLDEQQLKTINHAVVSQLKVIRQRKANSIRYTLTAGDRVGFGDRNARGKRSYKEGSLVRIKRTRAEVLVGMTTWTVPLNMLSAV